METTRTDAIKEATRLLNSLKTSMGKLNGKPIVTGEQWQEVEGLFYGVRNTEKHLAYLNSITDEEYESMRVIEEEETRLWQEENQSKESDK